MLYQDFSLIEPSIAAVLEKNLKAINLDKNDELSKAIIEEMQINFSKQMSKLEYILKQKD